MVWIFEKNVRKVGFFMRGIEFPNHPYASLDVPFLKEDVPFLKKDVLFEKKDVLFAEDSHAIFREKAIISEVAGFQDFAKTDKTCVFTLFLFFAGKYASLSEHFVRKVLCFSQKSQC